MCRQSGRQEIRCQCGKRLLDITGLVGEVTLETRCKCGKLIEVHVTAKTTTSTVKEAKVPALVS